MRIGFNALTRPGCDAPDDDSGFRERKKKAEAIASIDAGAPASRKFELKAHVLTPRLRSIISRYLDRKSIASATTCYPNWDGAVKLFLMDRNYVKRMHLWMNRNTESAMTMAPFTRRMR